MKDKKETGLASEDLYKKIKSMLPDNLYKKFSKEELDMLEGRKTMTKESLLIITYQLYQEELWELYQQIINEYYYLMETELDELEKEYPAMSREEAEKEIKQYNSYWDKSDK